LRKKKKEGRPRMNYIVTTHEYNMFFYQQKINKLKKSTYVML